MKKILSILIAIMLMTVSKSVFASDFSAVSPSGHTLQYTIINNNSVSVFRSGSPSGALVIPDSVTYNGYSYAITSIANNAFYSCSGLTTPNTYW